MEQTNFCDLNVSPRILLGPGPSMVAPRVLRAMATPLLGHLDPEFLQVMADEQQLLRQVFQTQNTLTLAVPGTGSAGMEASLCNFIEPGDAVLIASMGFFGERLCDMASRYGAQITRLEHPWGQVFDPAEVVAALKVKPYKLLALVHAETSTGALQPGIAEIAAAAHSQGTLVVLDTVTSLGGIAVEIDTWDVDVAYSAAQKSLSCPPGLAPITVGPRAIEALRKRKTPVANWYLDLNGLQKYWEPPHAYHHTAPISTHYALREGLRLAVEEGLQARFERHRKNAELLWDGLEALDLPPLIPLAYRLTTLTTPQLPPQHLRPAVDDMAVRRRLLDEFNIEIAGGFGPLKGKVWRIGLMGFSSRKENVILLLGALERLLS
jgi:alanine-glyoxylate transaminase/serine-glyoxylate transaminase/serine-pyruvate transaminase